MDRIADIEYINTRFDFRVSLRKYLLTLIKFSFIHFMLFSVAYNVQADSPLNYYSGFESGDYRTDWKGAHHCSSHSITTVKRGDGGDPTPRNGKFMARFELRPGDKIPSSCKEAGWSARAELYTEKGAKGGPIQVDEDNWIGWSIFVPKDWDPKGERIIVTQVHGGEVCDGVKRKKPQIILNIDNNRWGVANKWDKGMESILKTPLEKGVWTDWTMYFYPSAGNKGVIKLWKNGELVATKKGSNICKKANLYLKTGIYHSPNSTLKLYVDEVRIGGNKSSLSDVTPRGSETPTQIPASPSGIKVRQVMNF